MNKAITTTETQTTTTKERSLARDYVRGGAEGALAPRNLGLQKREQKEKQTVY